MSDTVLTAEQVAAKNSNPTVLMYPLNMKDKIPQIQCGEDAEGFGPFSVSATRQVMFSKGNLQFNAGGGTHKCADGTTQPGLWRFAEYQWDYVGNDADGTVYYNEQKSTHKQMSDSYDGWIDLYAWATSGWNSGASMYQPWSTYQWSPNYYPGNDSEADLEDDFLFADWGVYNKIGNNAPFTWRTLSYEEWQYLYNSRERASELCGHATVNGVKGFVFLPDDWVTPDGITFVSGTNLQFTDNNFTMSEWEIMEKNNAVFLPAAGWRNGTNAFDLQDSGCYWSSTHASTERYAWYFGFANKKSGLDNTYKHNGHSIRVVHDL